MTTITEIKSRFVARRIRESAREYGVTRRSDPAQFVHWKTVYEQEYFALVYTAAQDGHALRRAVLDSLSPRERYVILHDFPDNRHNGYVLPEAR